MFVIEQSASEGVIRLVGGRSMKEGRVEIFHNGEWGTVCEEKWDLKDAQVNIVNNLLHGSLCHLERPLILVILLIKTHYCREGAGGVPPQGYW